MSSLSPQHRSQRSGMWASMEETLSVHGIRRVLPRRRNLFFSILWCIILLLGLGLFIFEASQSLMLYLSYPTGWALDFIPPYRWPGITLCNLNPVRITQLAKNYWEKPGTSSEPATNGRRNFNWNQFLEERTYVSSRDFFLHNSHQIQDMVIRCTAGKLHCSSANFSLTATEDGLCHKIVPAPGVDSITLWLNSESYEYIDGLAHSTGLKLYVHHATDTPIRDDTHVYVFPGFSFDFIIGKEQYDSLEFPYGNCLSSSAALQSCLSDCYQASVTAACQCVPFWYSMNKMKGQPECNIYKHFTCVSQTIDNTHCTCAPSCTHVTYTAHLEMFPTNMLKLRDFFPPNHNLSSVSSTYSKTRDLHSMTTASHQSRDLEVITRFLSVYNAGKSRLAKMERDLYQAKVIVEEEVRFVPERVRIHTDIGLGGVRTLLREGYTRHWNNIQTHYLDRLTLDSRGVMSKFDRALKQLKFSTATQLTMAQVLYTIGDMDLSVKMDLSGEAINNATKLYYSYINAEPNLDAEITPGSRYDDALVPYSVLMADGALHKSCHRNLTNKISGYIESILQLKNLIRTSLSTRDYNETAKNSSRDQFIAQSVQIEKAQKVFSTLVVEKCENVIATRINNMVALNNSFVENLAKLRSQIAVMEGSLSATYRTIFQELAAVQQICNNYVNHSNTSIAEVTSVWTNYSLADFLYKSKQLTLDFLLEHRQLLDICTQLQDSVLRIWNQFFHEPLLSNFYVKVNNDVIQMMDNELKTQFLLKVFTSMLSLEEVENDTSVILEDFLVLLNADIAMMDFPTKSLRVNTTFQEVTDIINRGVSFINSLRNMEETVQSTHQYFTQYKQSQQLSQDFTKENLLQVKIMLNPGEYRQWTEYSIFPASQLLATLGGLMAFLLGASVLTILELCDILLSWCSSRYCHGSETTKEIPVEYRSRYKSPESLNSSLSTTRPDTVDTSLNSARRSYVTFKDFNHVRGSEV